jgi:hypothetical protein
MEYGFSRRGMIFRRRAIFPQALQAGDIDGLNPPAFSPGFSNADPLTD